MARFSRFLLGGAIGAGLALLFAPKPGRELRQRLLHGRRQLALLPAKPYEAPIFTPPAPESSAIKETGSSLAKEAEEPKETNVVAPVAAAAVPIETQAASTVLEQPPAAVAEPEETPVASQEQTMEEPSPLQETPVQTEPPAQTLTEAPAVLNQEEMRRRIEETRARLKAKAFDALVSGESFIPAKADAARENPAAATQLDQETEDKIDQSFKELY